MPGPSSSFKGENWGHKDSTRLARCLPLATTGPVTPSVLALQCKHGSGRSRCPWHHNGRVTVGGATGSESLTVGIGFAPSSIVCCFGASQCLPCQAVLASHEFTSHSSHGWEEGAGSAPSPFLHNERCERVGRHGFISIHQS